MAWVEHAHTDSNSLANAVARELRDAVADALATRGSALLALAGGRTPWPAYRALAAQPLAWSRVVAMPTDERCVPRDHPASNIGQMHDAFAGAKELQFAALTTPDGDPDASEGHARAMLSRHLAPFDAVVLGMGNDAHTASLFPGAVNLAEALDPEGLHDACRIDPVPLPPEAPFPRITLTLPRLLRARRVLLLVAGEEKREVLRRTQADHDALRQPVSALLHAPGTVVHIHWSP